jgi:hypothetical protein
MIHALLTIYPINNNKYLNRDIMDQSSEESYESYNSIMSRRLAIFSLKALKSPIEIRFNNYKIATGNLQSIDPLTLDFIVSNFCIQ